MLKMHPDIQHLVYVGLMSELSFAKEYRGGAKSETAWKERNKEVERIKAEVDKLKEKR